MKKEELIKKFSIKVNFYRKLIQDVMNNKKIIENENDKFDINLLQNIDSTLVELMRQLINDALSDNEVVMVQIDLERLCDKLETLLFTKHLKYLSLEEFKENIKQEAIEEKIFEEEIKKDIVEDVIEQSIESNLVSEDLGRANVDIETLSDLQENEKRSIKTQRVLKRVMRDAKKDK